MRNLVVSMVALGLVAARAPAQDAKGPIAPRELWTNLFADQDVTLHFSVAAGTKGRLVWTFATSAGRVHDKGRGEAQVLDGGKPVKVALRTPPLNPGVVQEAKLMVSLLDGQGQLVSTYERKIFIFHADPFADRAKWLADRHIKLYDPEAKTKTSTLFKEAKIPFEEIPRASTIDEVKDGVIIVGEGAALQEEPDLMPALVRAATRGLHVLCLAPASGNFVVPGSEPDSTPGSLTLARSDTIRKLDKRLDPLGWPPAGSVERSLALKAEEGKVVAEVQRGAKGFTWLAVHFPLTPIPLPKGERGTREGRLIVTGFAIVGSWEASPTPRYLLARILESFDE